MPINYQAPQAGGSFYQHAASNFSPANASLIGHEEALGQQQTLQNQRLLFEGGQQAAMEAARIQAAGQLAEQHAQLQVWVHGQDMTKADEMRMQQDLNKVAWIQKEMDEGRLERTAGYDKIAQLKGGIDLAKQRMQTQQLKLQAEQTAHVKAQTDVQNAIYHSMNAAADDKVATIIRPEFKDAARRAALDAGLDPDSEAGKQEAQAWAAQNGGVIHGLTQKDGSIKPLAEGKAASAGAGEGKAATERNHVQEVNDAHKAVNDWAKGQEPPPSDEARRKKFDEVMADYETAHQKFKSGTPAGQKDAREKQHQEALGKLQVDAKQIQEQENLPPQVKQAGLTILGIQKRLLDTYGPYESMRPLIKKKMDDLALSLKSIRGTPPEQKQGESTPAQQSAPPPPVQGNFPFGGTGSVVTTDNTTRQTPAEMIGAGGRRLYDAIFGESNPFR